MKFPGLMIETCDTAEEKRRAITVDFIVDLGILNFQVRHGFVLRVYFFGHASKPTL
jgi:hypothetical protein